MVCCLNWELRFILLFKVFVYLKGNCDGDGNSDGECPDIPPVDQLDFATDSSCPPPCGTGDSCQLESCKNIKPCVVCKNCTSLGYNDPCEALSHAVFGKFFPALLYIRNIA